MQNPELAARIVEATVKALKHTPVTVKIRAGWDDDSKNAPEMAKMLEAAGASMICVHGRTREQMYNPGIDVDIIKRVKELLADYNSNPTAENRLRLLYSIPSGIELTAQVVTNYGQLKTMWHQRHNHRLPEWREFCDWILSLPYFDELTGIKKETKDE
jgi:hypothetical protein